MDRPIEVLRLPAGAAAELKVQARACYPREACGFLVGFSEGGQATVTGVQAAENRAPGDNRFSIDAEDVFDANRRARDRGEELVAVFHSHPDSGARPSETDADDAWGGWVHLILGCEAGEVAEMRCWRWDDSAFVPVAIEEPT